MAPHPEINGTLELPAAEAPPRLWPERYAMLDGWRGLAALAVVFQHVSPLSGFDIGSVAVLLFFVISGYCIAASAESCLRKGQGFRTFMWKRVRRIYPPYMMSILVFVATRLAKVGMGGDNQLRRGWLVWVQNLTLAQWTSLLAHPIPHASVNPANLVAAYWSLNYEEQFYLVVGVFMSAAAAWGWKIWSPVIAVFFAGLIWNWFFPRLSFGFFLEYWAHFSIGCLVYYRLCRFGSVRSRRLADALLALVAVVGGVDLVRHGMAAHYFRSVGPELLIVSLFGLVLVAVRRFDAVAASTWLGRWAARLGVISYSLYLIHQCNLMLVHRSVVWIFPPGLPAPARIVVEMAAHVALGTGFWYLCERPFLSRRQVAHSVATPLVDTMNLAHAG